MAKTEGIIHYVCDRCAADAYLAANSAASADWRETKRIDQYGSEVSFLLCKSCTDAYKQLATKQDTEFQQFKRNVETAKETSYMKSRAKP